MSVLALDIGSSHIKALLSGWDGRLVEVRRTATPSQSVEPGEQAYPSDAVQAALDGLIAGLAAAHPDQPVDTLVFSCLGTAMVPLDIAGRPLGPALAPADARPQREPWLVDEVDMEAAELFARTGSDPAVPSFLLHMLWWKRARPQVFDRLHRFRSLRGHAVARLCGADVEDVSWASRTMLVDLDTNTWSERILAAAGLPADVLPPLELPTVTFPLRADAVERLGLADGAVAVLGAMDNGCSLFGAAGPDRSGLVNIVGTYEHMAGVASLEAVRDVAAAAGAIVHTYVLPDQYITMTRVAIGDLFDRVAAVDGGGLDALLDSVSARPQGRSMALDAKAVDEALRSGTSPRDVLQGLLEGAAVVLARFAAAWADLGLGTEPIAAVGGGSGHDAVLQLKANLLGRRLVTLASPEGAGLGALRLAAVAVMGASPDEACRIFENPIARTIEPGAVAAAARPGRT